MTKENKINANKLALSAGIVWAVIVFLTTLSSLYGLSNAAQILDSTIWSSFGYSVTWVGAFIGAIIGFIYAYVISYVIIRIYNKIL